MVRGARRPLIRLQTLLVQRDWGSYWYAALQSIPYERTGAPQAAFERRRTLPRIAFVAQVSNRKVIRTKNPYFVGGRGSARIRSLVLLVSVQTIQANIKSKQEKQWH